MGIKMNTHFLMDGDKLDGAIASKIPDYVSELWTKKVTGNFVGIDFARRRIFFLHFQNILTINL